MPPAPPTTRSQTIKQAKAAYKSRGQPSLTEKEKRQLERSIELDRRAWRSREAEKRKAETTRKKIEKDKKQKEELERVRLGSQRRCDRFGYKSSQMHLGAFLNKGNAKRDRQVETLQTLSSEGESDSFGDDDLDDQTILDAMAHADEPKIPHVTPQQPQTTSENAQTSVTTHHMASVHQIPTTASDPAMDDLVNLWEDLDSSTQIARDLALDEAMKTKTEPTSKASSFSSGDFDLTIEDMEELDPAPPVQSKSEQDKKLMPPPPLPTKHILPIEEFTMSQLERFVDDDLQLTQIDSG